METPDNKTIISDGKKRTFKEAFENLNSQPAVKMLMKDLAKK